MTLQVTARVTLEALRRLEEGAPIGGDTRSDDRVCVKAMRSASGVGDLPLVGDDGKPYMACDTNRPTLSVASLGDDTHK